MPYSSISSMMCRYTDGMQAVTEMSKGMELPSRWGMSAVTALPPIRSRASYSRKSNRSGWRSRAHAAASPDTPPPMMAIRRGIVLVMLFAR